MAKRLTEGRPFRLILQFAFPLLLGNLFQQLYNVVDTAIVGRFLGTKALAAVGASSSVQFLVLGFCMGTCSGFAIPVAQRFGAREDDAMRRTIYNACGLCAALALFTTTLCCAFCPQILRMLNTPEDIFEDAYAYQYVIFCGIPFTILYNILAAFMRAVGDSKTPFVFLCISTVLNIVMDLVFILCFHMGVFGAALATILAQAISGLLCLGYIAKRIPVLHIPREERHFEKAYIARLLTMGLPMGLQFSITAIGSMTMQSANNALGTIYVSGFTAGARIKALLMCPFDALSAAVSTFCGQNLGAKNYSRIKRGLLDGILIGVCYGTFACGVLWIFGESLAKLFIDLKEANAQTVLSMAVRYLHAIGCFYWLLGFLNVTRTSMQGLGYSGRAIFAGVMEMMARVLVSTLLVPKYKYWAICFADQSAWFSATVYILITAYFVMKNLRRTLPNPAN